MKKQNENNWFGYMRSRDAFAARNPRWLITYAVSEKNLEEMLRNISFLWLVGLEGFSTADGEIGSAASFEACSYLEIEVDVTDPGFAEERELLAKEAIRYLQKNIEDMFAECLWSFLHEALLKAFLARRQKGYYQLKTTEIQVFKSFIKDYSKRVRERMRISRQSGRKCYWDHVNRERLLSRYYELIEIVRNAKRDFKNSSKAPNWKSLLAEKYPELPTEILDRFHIAGKDGEPTRHVLNFLSPEFHNASIETMEDILAEEKSANKKRST